MPGEEIVFIAWPKINSQFQIFRLGRRIFCLSNRPRFLWVSVVRVYDNKAGGSSRIGGFKKHKRAHASKHRAHASESEQCAWDYKGCIKVRVSAVFDVSFSFQAFKELISYVFWKVLVIVVVLTRSLRGLNMSPPSSWSKFQLPLK